MPAVAGNSRAIVNRIGLQRSHRADSRFIREATSVVLGFDKDTLCSGILLSVGTALDSKPIGLGKSRRHGG